MTRQIKCPTCRTAATWENNPFRPFCSERCRLIDLGAWVDEKYRIPGPDLDAPSGDKEDEDPSEER